MQQHVDVQCRHADEQVGPVGLYGFEYLVHSEGGQNDGFAMFVEEGRHHAANPVYVTHWQHEEAHRAFRHRDGVIQHGAGEAQAAVRVHDSLRPPGGSGGVDDGSHILVVNVGYSGLFRACVQNLAVGVVTFRHGIAHEYDVSQSRHVSPAGLYPGQEIHAADQRPGSTILVDIGALVRSDHVIHGNNGGSDPPDGPEALEDLGAVGHLDKHPVSPLDTEALKSGGQSLGVAFCLDSGDFPALEYGVNVFAGMPDPGFGQLYKVHKSPARQWRGTGLAAIPLGSSLVMVLEKATGSGLVPLCYHSCPHPMSSAISF